MHKKVLLIIPIFFILSTSYSADKVYPVTIADTPSTQTLVCDVDLGMGLSFDKKKISVANCEIFELDTDTSFTKVFDYKEGSRIIVIKTGKHKGFGKVSVRLIRTDENGDIK